MQQTREPRSLGGFFAVGGASSPLRPRQPRHVPHILLCERHETIEQGAEEILPLGGTGASADARGLGRSTRIRGRGYALSSYVIGAWDMHKAGLEAQGEDDSHKAPNM